MLAIDGNRLKELFFSSPVLALTGAVMVLDLLACVIGLTFDRTTVTGMPAWMKPAKFAISTGIYAISVAVVIRYTPIWKRTLQIAGALIGMALTLEIVLIDVQAARHTASHFNVGTPFDRNVFQAMGVGIAVLWISSIVVMAATFRARYKSRVWTLAVRYGMLISVLGASTGAFMTTPSRAQIEEARATHRMAVSGSHTVGAPDGGEGLPMLGWSTRHGDIRVSHFVGLHGLQALSLLAFLLERRRTAEKKAVKILSVAILSYGSFFLAALGEALMKKPIVDHGPLFATVWICWAAISAALLARAARTHAGASACKAAA